MTVAEDEQLYARLTPGTRPEDWRSAVERDADRILSTSAFRRLGSVTQVVAVNETQLFHNRLSHSLRVAQLGYRFAEMLRARSTESADNSGAEINPSVMYAAGLAHDLGHPPFGHIGEDELQRCTAGKPTPGGGEDPAVALKDAVPELDGFEGNAQTFRIITKLAIRGTDNGLNLTRATLNGGLKYPWLRGEYPSHLLHLKKKWGAYASERAHFTFARQNSEEKTASLEAQIMEWADDVAYAIHDLEDFYRADLIPLDRLANSPRERQQFLDYAAPRINNGMDTKLVVEALNGLALNILPKSPYTGSRMDQADLYQFNSAMTSRYASALSLERTRLHINPRLLHEIEMLKQLTWYYIIDNPTLVTVQRGQRRIIRNLYRELRDWLTLAVNNEVSRRQLPTQLWELLSLNFNDDDFLAAYTRDTTGTAVARSVVDYISSLTELQTLRLFERLHGHSDSSALEHWLRA